MFGYMMLGFLLGNAVLLSLLIIWAGYEKQAEAYQRRRDEERAREEGERLKILAIEDFRRRERARASAQRNLYRGR